MEKINSEINNYVLREDVDFGTVKIADDVVAMIAGIAATEVEGVHGMAGNVGRDLLSKVGIRNLNKGVKVFVDTNRVKADLAIVIDYGYSIPTVSQKVQEKVKSTIESMTGLCVTDVNVRIAGVNVQGK